MDWLVDWIVRNLLRKWSSVEMRNTQLFVQSTSLYKSLRQYIRCSICYFRLTTFTSILNYVMTIQKGIESRVLCLLPSTEFCNRLHICKYFIWNTHLGPCRLSIIYIGLLEPITKVYWFFVNLPISFGGK